MRYNLVVGGVCTPRNGFFAGGVLPWLIAWTVRSKSRPPPLTTQTFFFITQVLLLHFCSFPWVLVFGSFGFAYASFYAPLWAFSRRRFCCALLRCQLYTGHLELELLSWAGLMLNSFIGFALPAAVALAAAKLAQQRWHGAPPGQQAGGGGPPQRLPCAQGLAAKALGPPQGYGGVDIDSPAGGGDEWTMGAVPATIVRALPESLRPWHLPLVQALCAAIALLVGLGLAVKVSTTFTPETDEAHAGG
jgi:hypothetical protein